MKFCNKIKQFFTGKEPLGGELCGSVPRLVWWWGHPVGGKAPVQFTLSPSRIRRYYRNQPQLPWQELLKVFPAPYRVLAHPDLNRTPIADTHEV